MNRERSNIITPGGDQSTGVFSSTATGLSDSGEPGLPRKQREPKTSGRLPIKTKTYMGTLNINTLIRAGKLLELGKMLDEQKIQLLGIQETRMMDDSMIDFGNYRLFKSKTNRKVGKGAPLLGMAFAVNKRILQSVVEVKPINNRLMTMRLKCANQSYTVINAHAPVNQDNKRDKEGVAKYWDKLEETMRKIPKGDVKILLGDFNAQLGTEKRFRGTIGQYPGHRFTNKNGQRLVELCYQHNMRIMSTHFKKEIKKTKTWRSPVKSLGEYQIDHVAITYKNHREIMNVQVRRGANIDSDHYLTRIKIRLTPRRMNKKGMGIPKFDISKIKSSGIKQEWEEETATTWEEFKEKITRTAKEKIPLTKRKRHPWWNDACEEAIESRKIAYNRWNSDKTDTKLAAYMEVRKQAARDIRRVKREYERDQLKGIEEDFRNYNVRNFYKTFQSRIMGYQPQNLCFRKKDGELALSNRENCETLAKYFEELLNCPAPTERFPRTHGIRRNDKSEAPDESEIKRQIMRLRNGRTAGEDGIVAELLKEAGPNTIREITGIIQNIWETEKLPEDWKCAVIHPLHKKGDRTDVNNYRGISLLSVAYKILSQCLLDRTQSQLQNTLGEYQAGFRPGRSCAEQILNLKMVLSYQAMRGRKTVCTFVDFRKAYDSIDRLSLIQELEERGLDEKTTNIIKQTLTDTKSKVKFMGELSEPFGIRTGVRQGDGLSPLLFNLMLDKVVREWEKELKTQGVYRPIRLGRKNKGIDIGCLAFADDLAILTDDTETAVKQIEILWEKAGRVGLQISFEKTEYMSNQKDAPDKITTRYGNIKRVNKFKYLGEMIQANGIEKEAYNQRDQKMTRAFWRTGNIYNKACLSRNTKVRHYNTVIKPETLYASEALVMNRKGELERIKRLERRIVRKILGPNKTTEGYRLRSRQETERVSNIIHDMMRRRLMFYGHIKRLPDTRLTKQIVDYAESIKNMKWIAEVREDLRDAGIADSDIRDREIFRCKVRKWEVNREVKKLRTGTAWSEERKKAHSEKMKEVWRLRKSHVK